MAAKWNWLCICKNEESNIFTAGNKCRPGNIKWLLAWALVVISITVSEAQKASPEAQKPVTEAQPASTETKKFSRQKVTFSLFDKNGTQLTDAAISTGKIRVFTLRDPKTITHSHLTYDRSSKHFTFSESAISPGMILAIAVGTDIMYLSLYGRSADRVIDGLKVQNGSYVLSSDDFAGRKQLKVENWDKYLEDGVAPQQQDLTSYQALLKDKRPIEMSDHAH
jgi:hypothetical protein